MVSLSLHPANHTQRSIAASTIVDATGSALRIVRDGGVSWDRLVEVVGIGAFDAAEDDE
jgi:tRNA A37 threonylcarbamoyladenosine synthetase subunit TsaC/SUA5/YrdC